MNKVYWSKTYHNLCILETSEAIPSDWFVYAIRIDNVTKIVTINDLIYIGEL